MPHRQSRNHRGLRLKFGAGYGDGGVAGWTRIPVSLAETLATELELRNKGQLDLSKVSEMAARNDLHFFVLFLACQDRNVRQVGKDIELDAVGPSRDSPLAVRTLPYRPGCTTAAVPFNSPSDVAWDAFPEK